MFVFVAMKSFKASLTDFELDLLACLAYFFQALAAIALALFVCMPDAHAALDAQSIGAVVMANQSPIDAIGNMLFSLAGSVVVVVIVLNIMSRARFVTGARSPQGKTSPNRSFAAARSYTSTPNNRYGYAYNRQKYHNFVYDELMNQEKFLEFRSRLAEREKEYWQEQQHNPVYSDYDPSAIAESIAMAEQYLAECEQDIEQVREHIQEADRVHECYSDGEEEEGEDEGEEIQESWRSSLHDKGVISECDECGNVVPDDELNADQLCIDCQRDQYKSAARGY